MNKLSVEETEISNKIRRFKKSNDIRMKYEKKADPVDTKAIKLRHKIGTYYKM